MLIGVPYYAREWPTASGIAPSTTTGNGIAYTWTKIRNNSSGNYFAENKNLEPNSFGPYYAYQDNGWYQCFVNDPKSLERRYKLVNQRGLAGIGIWALGYDNGHLDLWDVIAGNFTQSPQITLYDTLYDSGGPEWNYYNDEDYIQVIHGQEDESLVLEFTEFDLETGYDSLWIYDGDYPGGELIGAFTGSAIPPQLYASDVMSIRFKSDHNTTASGWTAIVESMLISIEEPTMSAEMSLFPNPASSVLNMKFPENTKRTFVNVYDMQGKLILAHIIPPETSEMTINISELHHGIYLIALFDGQNIYNQKKLLIY
jgi:hypothetical protein